MQTFLTINETKNCLFVLKKEGKKTGFVPTMGALHKGHLALLERAKNENDIVVCSIFVNPLQFNDKKDLEKYPRTLEKDAELLKSAGCDILFAPSSEEMYPPSPIRPPSGSQEADKQGKGNPEAVPLGHLELIMEGKHRPGHFQGVCVVVKKLFDIVEPQKAYFGEKDFQQLAVIKHMVKELMIPVEIVACPTVREHDGLAMSSRNTLLSPEERNNASLIPKTLFRLETNKQKASVAELKKWVEEVMGNNPLLKLDYFEVVNAETLLPVKNWGDAKKLRACIAVKTGNIRLIDNIPL